MKHRYLLACICATLLIVPATAWAQNTTHSFLNLPADTITTAIVEQALLDHYGEVRLNDYGKYLINDLGGYEFAVSVEYNDESKVGVSRIFMSSTESGWGKGDEFKEVISRDIAQFLVMEQELMERYGEPDERFFYTDPSQYKLSGWTRFMFPSGSWTFDDLMGVCEAEGLLIAYTRWDNLRIRLWVDWQKEKKPGFLSMLNWYYTHASVLTDVSPQIIVNEELVPYPPVP